MDISSYGSFLHLLVASRDAAVANIIPDGVIKKNSILGNHADVSSQRCLLHLRNDNRNEISSVCL